MIPPTKDSLDIKTITKLYSYSGNNFLRVIRRHELWKPDLRALMESDMKAVSDGRKTRPQVLQVALEGMKSLFISVSMQLIILCPSLCWSSSMVLMFP
jgi:DNA topoisomerase IA